MDLSDSRDKIDDVDARVTALEGDIGSCDGCMSAAELADWSKWRNDWRAARVQLRAEIDNVGTGLEAASVGGILVIGAAESVATRALERIDQKTDGWARELGTWQQRAAARGAHLSSPGESPALGLPWTTIAVVGLGVVAVVGLGVYAAKKRRPSVKKNPRRARR